MATKKKEAPKEVTKKPASKPTDKPIAEAVTPKADKVPGGACKRSDCQHADAMHYGGSNRWCNVSGCTCQAHVA